MLDVKDSIESIFDCCKNLARTYSYGGGCGIDISNLAPKGAAVNNAAKSSTGAVSFMDMFSMVTSLIAQNGRRGAMMISMSCEHPDIKDFITIKSDLNKVTSANISVRMTDAFMDKAVAREDVTLSFTRPETGETVSRTVNAGEILDVIAYNNWDTGEPGVLFWDRIQNYNLLSEHPDFSYAGVNPCAEEPLPAGGSCLLGSINLAEFVKDDGSFNFDEFTFVVRHAVRALNDVLDEGLPLHPLQIQRDCVRDWRQIGLGIMGLGDMLIKMGIEYGSFRAVKVSDSIGYAMAAEALWASTVYGKSFPKCDIEAIKRSPFYKVHKYSPFDPSLDICDGYLYNSQLLTIAPTGTLSTMLGISGGIEPVYATHYVRKTQSLHGEDVSYKVYTPIVERYMKEHDLKDESELPSFFVTAKDIPWEQRIDMQAAWQKHIDASISSTINLPNSATREDVRDIIIKAWKSGLKGITVFRDGCRRSPVLSTEDTTKKDTPKKEALKKETPAESNELKRGEILSVSKNLIGKKRKLITGCGSLYCSAWFDPNTGELMETFLDKGSTGGCMCNLVAISRLMSLAARGGISMGDIVDQLLSGWSCPSYVRRSATKNDTSKGSSCPIAVANAILDMHDEMQRELKEKNAVDEPRKENVLKIETNEIAIMGNGKPLFHVPGESTAYIERCPSCNEPIAYEGGCKTCRSCGWSKCD